MTTPAKATATKAKTKSATPPAAKAPAKAKATPKAATKASTEPSLRFYHSKELRAKTEAVLSALETTPDHPKHGESLADLVNELIDAGMDYYFMRALKEAQVGFMGEQSARLGMSGAVKLISSVSRKFIVRMDKDQLLIVASHIRTLT